MLPRVRCLLLACSVAACTSFFRIPALAAELDYPLAIAVSEAGEIYLADRNLPGVWRVNDGELSLYFEGSKKFRTPLNAVRCLAFDNRGNLLAGDSSTREVYRFDAGGKPVPLSGGAIGIPMSIAVNKAGELLVADLELHCIWKVPSAGGKPFKLAEVPAPSGVCLDAEENLWVVSRGKEQLLKVSPEGKVEPLIKMRTMQFPHNVVLDKSGTAYITDGYEKAVWKLPPGGELEKWVSGAPLDNPVGLAWRGTDLLIVDPRAKAVFEINPEGKAQKLPWKAK